MRKDSSSVSLRALSGSTRMPMSSWCTIKNSCSASPYSPLNWKPGWMNWTRATLISTNATEHSGPSSISMLANWRRSRQITRHWLTWARTSFSSSSRGDWSRAKSRTGSPSSTWGTWGSRRSLRSSSRPWPSRFRTYSRADFTNFTLSMPSGYSK